MNNDKSITAEKLCSLWSVNISKMNFQQTVCFHLRNWAFGITGIVVALSWTEKPFAVRVLIHVITILLLGLILHKDLSWHAYFSKYRERALLCENAIVKGEIDMNRFVKDYLEKKEKSRSELLKSTFSNNNFFLLRTDYVELYLILFLVISLVTTTIIAW